jgi:WD40 repeat protein
LYCLSFSPDGKTCATGHLDGTIRLWDPATGRLRRSLQAHRVAVYTLAYSPDGKYLASGGGRGDAPTIHGELFLWDLANPASPRALGGPGGAVNFLAFSPDGLALAAARNREANIGQLQLWSVPSGASRFTIPFEGSAASVAFAADDPGSLAVGCNGRTHLIDAAKGTSLGIWRGTPGQAMISLARAPGGLIASGSRDRVVRLWKSRPGEPPVAEYRHDSEVWGAALSADGKTVASVGRDGVVVVWDWNSPRQRFSFRLPQAQGRGRAVAFSPDGKTLAVGMEDGKLWLCDVPRAPEALSWLAHREGTEPREAWAVAFSPDGKTLASAGDDHAVRLWDPATGEERRTLKGHDSLVTCLAFSPDGKLLATGSYDGTLRIWDAAGGREVASLPHPSRSLWCLAFSPDGTFLASGGKDAKVRLWDTRTCQPLPLPGATHADTIHSLAFAPDGRSLVVSWGDGTLGVWWKDTRAPTGFSPADGASVHLRALAFSPDGRTLATVHDREGSVRLRRVGTWEELAVLGSHKTGARAVAFSPDGKTLVVGHLDGVIRLWHVATGRELLAFRGSGVQVNSLAFAPDGKTLAAACHDGFLKLWRGATDDEIRQAEQWERER